MNPDRAIVLLFFGFTVIYGSKIGQALNIYTLHPLVQADWITAITGIAILSGLYYVIFHYIQPFNNLGVNKKV